jgi:flagellum-specific peptidoglycan hydrolase FlgJ
MITQSQIQRANIAAQSLFDRGVSIAFLPLAIAQLAHETAGFTSRVMTSDNNLSGIKYIGNSKQKNATAGTRSPEGNYYAKFATIEDWATDYIRILSMGARPIDSTSVYDFANRLKQNNYYTDTVENYTAGLTAWKAKFENSIDVKKKFLA